MAAGWRRPVRSAPAGGCACPPRRVGAERAPYLAAETITIEPGDNLWNLSLARLAEGGLPHDDADVVAHVEDVIAANGRIVEDPDLIYPGERFEFPAVGTPPPGRPLRRPGRSGKRRRRRGTTERVLPPSRRRHPRATTSVSASDRDRRRPPSHRRPSRPPPRRPSPSRMRRRRALRRRSESARRRC